MPADQQLGINTWRPILPRTRCVGVTYEIAVDLEPRKAARAEPANEGDLNPDHFFETGVKYPALEGVGRTSLMSVEGAGTNALNEVRQSFADGGDILTTITWRPDSTMTVTADGQPIVTRLYTPPPSGRVHLFIMGTPSKAMSAHGRCASGR